MKNNALKRPPSITLGVILKKNSENHVWRYNENAACIQWALFPCLTSQYHLGCFFFV
ncbi:hypothetical protein HanIR_Chr02g0086261 [Helianthus annuus]|nr:hypothetical protein HanIR_Chr02g0086261 [Helianthus annuus]